MKRTLAPVATILVAMVSIQSGAALAKQLFPVVGAAGASALRLVFAAAILLLVWKPFGGNRMDSVGPAERRAVVLYGVSLGTMNLLFYFALERIPLGLAVAFEFCGPLTIALIRSRRALESCGWSAQFPVWRSFFPSATPLAWIRLESPSR